MRRHATAVQRHRQAEVAQHRRPLGGKPDVSGLEVAVDDAVLVRVVQRQRHLLGRTYGLVDRQPVSFSVRELLLHRAARHIARDDVGLSFVLAHVVHHDHVRVIAQAPHRLRLAPHAHETAGVETLRLDHCHCHIPVQLRVVRQIDAFAPALAEEALHGVAAIGERRRQGR